MKIKKLALSPTTTDTLIGEGTVIEGRIVSKASLRIEGKVNGDVECSGDVTIGESGIAFSSISARNVINAGTINGSVSTKGTLTVTNSGKMIGCIEVGTLIIAEGGLFQGISEMDTKSQHELHDDKTPERHSGELAPVKSLQDKNSAAG